MALTEDESKTLEALLKKKDEPDNGGGLGKVVNVMIDLGDDEQVRRGLKLGFLEAGDLDFTGEDDGDGDGDGAGGDDDGDDGPARKRGYFDKKS